MSQKSYDGNNGLYLIPTPIGNMRDITLRSIDTLKGVDVIFSEDTRVTIQLLNFLNIKKKLISSHKFNESKNCNLLLQYLEEGKNVGIVTDRGTPIISDPGYELVVTAIDNGYHVIALPGPTALVPALITSGLSCQPFLFYGFLNNKGSKRRKELQKLQTFKDTLIFYESPHRILDTLNDMLEIFGNRKISISREISKKYEEVFRGRIRDIIQKIIDIKGEFVIVVEGNIEKQSYENLSITEHVNIYIKEGYSKMDAMKLVAKDRKISKSIIYTEYIREENIQ